MTSPALSIVKSNTPSILPETDVIRLYAAHLEEQSWCIDVSKHPIEAFHADSNQTKVIDDFMWDFPKWSSMSRIRVAEEAYTGFLHTLADRLVPRMHRVVGSAFKPVPEKFFERNGAKFANTYVPFNPEVPEKFEMPSILEQYLGRVFMSDQDRKYVTEWCADIIQNPSRRPMWSVVLTGAQGSGKSSIYRLVSAALGYRHTWEHNEYTPAFKQHSEVLPDNLLVSFDDAKPSRDTYQKLKQAITRTSMWVELKFVQKIVLRDVYARIMICSNSLCPMPGIDQGDRRLYVVEPSQHRESPEETAAFFVGFNAWLQQSTTPAILYHWLKTIDLADFVHGSTIKTETHAKMVGLSTSVLETLLAEYVEDGPIFHNVTLLNYLSESGCRYPKADDIKMLMAALNYEHKRRKVEGCGERQHSLWQPIAVRSRSLDPDEIEEIKIAVGATPCLP